MSAIIDPLSQLEDAIIAWLSTNPVLKEYNWQRWESDVDLKQPRGYVNVTVVGELDMGIQGPVVLQTEVVLESVPKSGSQAEIVPIMLAMLSGREIIDRINSQIKDESLWLAGPPEAATVRQVIERELRVRRFTISYPAVWSVVYV